MEVSMLMKFNINLSLFRTLLVFVATTIGQAKKCNQMEINIMTMLTEVLRLTLLY